MVNGLFLVSVSGQIETINVLASAGTSWHLKYEFVSGPDWTIANGLEAGLSQTATAVNNSQSVTLNLPIEIVYKSTNPYGCMVGLVEHTTNSILVGPQIVVSVYKGTTLQGYGRAHIPLNPGLQKVKVSLSKPQPTSLLGYIGMFFGYQPEILQPKMLATTAGNYLIQMVSSGEVDIVLNVVFHGFNELGYDFGA